MEISCRHKIETKYKFYSYAYSYKVIYMLEAGKLNQ